MPVGIIRPSNQVKQTNLAVVHIKKGKKRFEVACYKNKVLDFRAEIEKNIDEVIQKDAVFTNVSKGESANKADLAKAWPGKKMKDIIEDIVRNGELQVGEKERQAKLERLHNEVVDIVSGQLVDPKSKRPYPSGMIQKALDQLSSQAAHQKSNKAAKSDKPDATAAENGESKENEEKPLPRWTGIQPNRTAKQQALFAMKALVAHQPIPVMRARMQLRVTCATSVLKHTIKSAPIAHGSEGNAAGEEKRPATLKDTILSFFEQVESQDIAGDEWEVVGFVEPGAFKTLGELISTQTKGRANIEVLEVAVKHEDD